MDATFARARAARHWHGAWHCARTRAFLRAQHPASLLPAPASSFRLTTAFALFARKTKPAAAFHTHAYGGLRFAQTKTNAFSPIYSHYRACRSLFLLVRISLHRSCRYVSIYTITFFKKAAHAFKTKLLDHQYITYGGWFISSSTKTIPCMLSLLSARTHAAGGAVKTSKAKALFAFLHAPALHSGFSISLYITFRCGFCRGQGSMAARDLSLRFTLITSNISHAHLSSSSLLFACRVLVYNSSRVLVRSNAFIRSVFALFQRSIRVVWRRQNMFAARHCFWRYSCLTFAHFLKNFFYATYLSLLSLPASPALLFCCCCHHLTSTLAFSLLPFNFGLVFCFWFPGSFDSFPP